MADESKWFDVPTQCLHRDCTAHASTRIKSSGGGWGWSIQPPAGWYFYALGFPGALPNLGVCPEHQTFTVSDGNGPDLDVTVRAEMHGIVYEIRQGGQTLGKITFPSNTLEMQPVPSATNAPSLKDAGARVAEVIYFARKSATS